MTKTYNGHVKVIHADSDSCPINDGHLCNICELFICAVCGGAEGSLASECPQRRITWDEQDAIYAGTLDFKNGEWVRNNP